MSKKAEGFSLRFVLINTGNISRKVLSKVLRSFDKNFERLQRGFEKPQQKEYALVYEGEVDTFSLEDVWEKFGRRVPRDFEGHALSISDVVEFSEEEVSRYFYVEPKGFAEITFKLE